MEEKSTRLPEQAYLYWIDNHKPKIGPLFDIIKESKKEFIYALRALGSPNKNVKLMPWLRLYGKDLPKNSGRTSERARNHGSHLKWEVKQEMTQSLSCGENTFQHC